MLDWSSLFDGGVDLTPPVTEEQLQAVPAKRGVAVLLAGAPPHHQPILLMTAASLRSRVAARMANPEPAPGEDGAMARAPGRKVPDLRAITTRVAWRRAFSHFETDLYYYDLSRRIWPGEYTRQLAWKPPWFVHVNPDDPFPHFARTREVGRGGGTYLGPFPSGGSAEQFIEALEDAFDLCRDYRCLRQAPHGRPCSYAQIGRCRGPCCGRISMDAYRAVMRRALEFARGDRTPFAEELRERMKSAADSLAFEAAGALKAKRDRLRAFEQESYAHVRPAEDFRFVLVQSGESYHRLRTFFADRGAIERGEDLEVPPPAEALARQIDRMAAFCAPPRTIGEDERWRMGLVAHYLFCATPRRGVQVRFHAGLSPADLARAIEEAAALLHWSPARRKGAANPGEPRPEG